ncbi:hypothetical protein, partial [Bifidobacterium vansinderenii]
MTTNDPEDRKSQDPLRNAFIEMGTKQYFAEYQNEDDPVLGISLDDFKKVQREVNASGIKDDLARLVKDDERRKNLIKSVADQLHFAIDMEKTDYEMQFAEQLERIIYETPSVFTAYHKWAKQMADIIAGGTLTDDERSLYSERMWELGWLLESESHEQCKCVSCIARSKDLRDAITEGQLGGRKSALDCYADEMRKATPGTFGTWAFDTSQRHSTLSEQDSLALEQLRNDYEYAGEPDHQHKVDVDKKDLLGALYDKFCTDEKHRPNTKVMFLFLNWGDMISPYRPLHINPGPRPKDYCGNDLKPYQPDLLLYHDFSGPLFASTEPDPVWSYGLDAQVSGKSDNIGRFVRAVYDTPLRGGFMTDFYKGIATPDSTLLNQILEGNSAEVDNAMLQLLQTEHDILKEANEQRLKNQGQSNIENRSRPLLLVTSRAYSVIRYDLGLTRKQIKIKPDGKKQIKFKPASERVLKDIKPWQIIPWPHHSGSNGHFQAKELIEAYGRAFCAINYVDDGQTKLPISTDSSEEKLKNFFCIRFYKDNQGRFRDLMDTVFKVDDPSLKRIEDALEKDPTFSEGTVSHLDETAIARIIDLLFQNANEDDDTAARLNEFRECFKHALATSSKIKAKDVMKLFTDMIKAEAPIIKKFGEPDKPKKDKDKTLKELFNDAWNAEQK